MTNLKIIKLKQLLADKLGLENTSNLQFFLGGVFWSTLGVSINAFIMFVVSVVAGRIIGPVEYGKYGLIVTISAILSSFIAIGFNTAVMKYGSAETDPNKRGAIFSYGLVGLLLMCLVMSPLVYFSSNFLARFLNTSQPLVIYGLLITIINMFKALFDSFLMAEKKFRILATIKIVESLVIAALFILLLKHYPASFLAYYWTICLGGIVSITIYLFVFRGSFRSLLNLDYWKKILHYQLVNVGIIIIGVVINNMDKLFVNKYLLAESLGIYSAYLTASLLVFSQLASAVYNVLLPSMTKIEDKSSVINTIDRFFIRYSLLALLGIGSVTGGIVYLFGKKYGINYSYIALFSVYTYLYILATFYSSIVASSKRLLSYGAKFAAFKVIFLFILYGLILLLKKTTISSIAAIMILSYAYDIFTTKIALKLYNRRK